MDYKSFARFKTVTVGEKNFRIKRLNIGETLEFQAGYNYWLFYKQGAEDLLRLAGITDDVTDEEAVAIITAEKEYCFTAPDETEKPKIIRKKADNADWLISMIAQFAYYFGWTRDEVLALYFDEAKALLEKMSELRISSIYESIGANNPTKKFLDGLKKSTPESRRDEPNEADRQAIEAIKAAQRRR